MSDLFSLQDRVVVITGGAGLLGRQHGKAVADAGGLPVLLDVDGIAVRRAAREVGPQAHGLEADITDEGGMAAAADWVSEVYGSLHGIVNNAANNPRMKGGEDPAASRLERFDLDRWQADVAVGLTGAFLCVKHFGPLLENGGAIINVVSDLGLIAPDQRLYREAEVEETQQPVTPVSYSAVESGLIGLTRYLSTYWTDKEIRCNAICPGGVEGTGDEVLAQRIRERIPFGRMARPDEYRGLIVFLLSQASAYINGTVIAADGGRTAW